MQKLNEYLGPRLHFREKFLWQYEPNRTGTQPTKIDEACGKNTTIRDAWWWQRHMRNDLPPSLKIHL